MAKAKVNGGRGKKGGVVQYVDGVRGIWYASPKTTKSGDKIIIKKDRTDGKGMGGRNTVTSKYRVKK